MPPISSGAFAEALRGLRDAELVAFVAALWAARGWDVRVEGRRVVATRDGSTSRIEVQPRRRLSRRLVDRATGGQAIDAGEEADAIVVRSNEPPAAEGVRLIDAAELRGMALYAVGQRDRDRLFERHLGRPATVEPPSGGLDLEAVPVSLVLSVVLLAVAGTLGAVGADGLSTAPTPTPTASSPSSAAATATPVEAGYPAGIGPNGIVNVNTVAVSHVLAVSSRSHRWELHYREVVDGRPAGALAVTVHVQSDRVYRSTVERTGTLAATPTELEAGGTYADGNVRYHRIEAEDAVSYQRHVLWPWGDPGQKDLPPFNEAPIRIIDHYLDVTDSRLVNVSAGDGTRLYVIEGRGAGGPNVTDVRVRATIDADGVVREIQARGRLSDGDARVEVAFRVDGIGTTTVSPPPWLETARNATDDRDGVG